MPHDFQPDIDAVNAIAAVPTILDVVCRVTGMGFAAVARVTDERWIACSVKDDIAFGLVPGGELKVETTICHEIRASRQAVVIDDVQSDAIYCRHGTPALYGFRSYISMPIELPDGRFFGTLCAIDPNPAKLKDSGAVGMFKVFADLIAFHLDSLARNAQIEATLADERKTSELREQFIAVLGHDLRNPLAAIRGGVRLLSKAGVDEKAASIVALMNSTVTRMASLIDNTLDFARGRLGGGIPLEMVALETLEPVLEQVVAELRAGDSDRVIETHYHFTRPVNVDPARIGQLFSNLLGNALTHGSAEHPVVVRAETLADAFELSVANAGDPIPPLVAERLFQPFFRGEVRSSLQGLGLGLYIASEIARAHGGSIRAFSDATETRFVFRMPYTPGAHA